MAKSRILSCGLALALALLPVAASAENLINLPPEMRFLRAQTDLGEVTENASVTAVDPQSLPSTIEEEIKVALVSHGIKLDRLTDVATYAWTSPGLVQQNHPPNYIVDFIKMMRQDTGLSQDQKDLCNSEGCLIFGYTFVSSNNAAGGAWKRDFETRSLNTAFVPVKEGNSDKYKVYIQTINNPAVCTDGVDSDDGCHRQFVWRNFGLSIVRQSR